MKLPNNSNWIINYDTFSWWLEGDNFQKHLKDLGEDLLQLENRYQQFLIDVGWYPMGDVNGKFVIQTIKNFDWENPLSISKCKTPFQVIEIIEKLMKGINKRITLEMLLSQITPENRHEHIRL